ncbi:MAG: SusC/RagA family TonB-linked outer membrane protein [Gemmatimonadota bacterium]|nr:SusC/RagA family TonB-linked outer membrane protein [Gemmatimonadota bacterium]
MIILAGCLAGAMVGAAATAAQDARGSITGRVTDRTTQEPVEGAQIFVTGTTIRVVTSTDGTYRLANVPAGRAAVRVARIGYEARTDAVTVTGGASATLDFALNPTATTLGEVLVTATGEEQLRREQPTSVGRIDPTPSELAASANFSDILASRAAGVTVHQSSGTTGGGSRVRIRGSNSVSLSNDPLIIVDGVKLNSAGNSTTIGVGGQQPSRFNDINPEDIEKIDIIKGPAAAALYGTAAANGVIQITTKRGRSGRARWTISTEGGTIVESTDFPANLQRVGQRSPTDTIRVGVCTLDSESRGFCVPRPDSTYQFNPLEQASPFRDGWRQGYGLSVSGGGDVATYYVGTDYEREQGVYDINNLRRLNVRANLRGQIRDNLDLTVTSGYLTSRLRFPQNDNNILGVISSGLLGGARDCSPQTPCAADTISRGYVSQQPPEQIFAIDTRQNVERFTGGLNSNWQPLGWLRMVGQAGLDYLARYDNQLIPPNRVNFGTLPEGSRNSNPFQIFTYTANSGATGSFQLTPSIHSTTSLGAQLSREVVRGTTAFGARLLAGTGSLSGTSARFAVGEANTENVTLGAYVQQQLAFRDRVYLTGTLRRDRNSAFGEDFGFISYPAIGGSWVVSEESFFPQSDWLSSFRLRASFGTSGQQPTFRDAVTFFTPVAVTANVGNEVPAITVGGTGNVQLKPEKSEEIELGFDVSVLRDRVGLELTYYDKTTTDALVAVRIPPSVGASQTRFDNLGRVSNKGVEIVLNADILDRPAFGWEVDVNAATTRNRLERLGLPAPIIFNGSIQRHTENRPLGAFYQRTYTFEDKNGDGVISRVGCPGVTTAPGVTGECEVTVGDTAFLGNPFPTREVSVNNTFTMFRWLAVRTLLDYRGGFKQVNLTERFRCVTFINCPAVNDPSAPLEEQARAIAGLMGTDAGYIEDATFWKLRELAVTATLPDRWARGMRAEGVSLTLAGRNLATWTDYTGFDPEVNFAAQNNFVTTDFLTQPPVRSFIARLNLTY